MTDGIDASYDFSPFDPGSVAWSPLASKIAPGVVILTIGALFGVWTLYVRPAPAPRMAAAPAAAPAAPPTVVAANPYGGLLDPRFSAGAAPPSLAQGGPLASNLVAAVPPPSLALAEPDDVWPPEPQADESAPLPVPRPPELAAPAGRGPLQPSRRLAQQTVRAVPGAAPDNRSFFEKIFGMAQPSGQPARQALAYAAPEDGAVGNALRLPSIPVPSIPVPSIPAPSGPAPRADGGTAVYDVSAHTVYMPNGERLEAHSGLGAIKDDPRYVSERMRGPTPPNVYQLTLREQLFHGVQALRLTPVGGGTVYGRTGLLAHRYMLGPNGDSNGCVSFRNYEAFLQAYQKGQVQRLVVVARSN